MSELKGFDPSELLGTGVVDEPTSETSELQNVATRISAQYGEVIAAWSTSVLRSTEPADAEGLKATVVNMLRLASSSDKHDQVELLHQLDEILDAIHGTRPRSRAGDHARVRLRDWLPSFADTLDGDDAERLRGLVEWSPDRTPFLEELRRHVRGVGPRRLQRLYAAGLGRLDIVANADPDEVSQVTGIPGGIATDMVERSRTYAIEERIRCIEEMRDRAARLKMLLTRIDAAPGDDLVNVANHALDDVEGVIRVLKQTVTGDAQ